jgi:hypothetical protein
LAVTQRCKLKLILFCLSVSSTSGHNKAAAVPGIMFLHNSIPNRKEGGANQRAFMNCSVFRGLISSRSYLADFLQHFIIGAGLLSHLYTKGTKTSVA